MYLRIKKAQGPFPVNQHGVPQIAPVTRPAPKPASWSGTGGFVNEQNWRPSGGFVNAAAHERAQLLPHLGNAVANALASPTANANAGRRAALRFYGV